VSHVGSRPLERERLSAVGVLRDTMRVWRTHAVQLWILAAMVLAPLAVIELAGYRLAVDITAKKFDPATALVNLFVILVFEIGSAEVEAVAAEKMVGNELHGHRLPSFLRFLREVPWVRLVFATLVFEIAVLVGIAFFVLPGIVVLVYFTLYGPVIVVEGRTVRGAFRRSAQLVRGNYWRVLAVAGFVIVVSEGIGAVVARLLDGAPHWAHVLGFYGVDVLLTPLQGVAIAVAYYALVALEKANRVQHDDAGNEDAGTREEPAGAGPSGSN
jgi:hypothetical protein